MVSITSFFYQVNGLLDFQVDRDSNITVSKHSRHLIQVGLTVSVPAFDISGRRGLNREVPYFKFSR